MYSNKSECFTLLKGCTSSKVLCMNHYNIAPGNAHICPSHHPFWILKRLFQIGDMHGTA